MMLSNNIKFYVMCLVGLAILVLSEWQRNAPPPPLQPRTHRSHAQPSIKKSATSAERQTTNPTSTTENKANQASALAASVVARSSSSSTSSSAAPVRPEQLPPLSKLVQGNEVIGNVSFLLQFAIVGFPKTGTTALMNFLGSQSEMIAIPTKEVHYLTCQRTADMVRFLYNQSTMSRTKTTIVESPAMTTTTTPPPLHKINGYKAPRDIMHVNVLGYFRSYWPDTKLIVGLRHPVEWFESFYNYRCLRRGAETMPPPHLLIGESIADVPHGGSVAQKLRRSRLKLRDQGVTTDGAKFHVALSRLGKTNVSHPREDALLGPRRYAYANQKKPLRNPVFLYESSQLEGDSFPMFQSDLAKFLGLSFYTLATSSTSSSSTTTDQTTMSPPIVNRTSAAANYNPHRHDPFNICDEAHAPLRQILVEIGRNASTWILDYFVPHPDVTISSRTEFAVRLQAWRKDPCPWSDL